MMNGRRLAFNSSFRIHPSSLLPILSILSIPVNYSLLFSPTSQGSIMTEVCPSQDPTPLLAAREDATERRPALRVAEGVPRARPPALALPDLDERRAGADASRLAAERLRESLLRPRGARAARRDHEVHRPPHARQGALVLHGRA